MKSALIVTIVLAVTVSLSPRCKAEKQAVHVVDSAYRQNPSALVAIFRFPTFHHANSPATNDEHGQNQSPDGNTTPEWVLVGVTSITAIFIGWQALETRRAAKAAADSVEAINRQAGTMQGQLDEMKSQTEALNKSVSHAEKNATAAEDNARAARDSISILIGKERARLRIDSADLILNKRLTRNDPIPVESDSVRFKVCHAGASDAFILDSRVEIWYDDNRESESPVEAFVAIPLPKIIKASDPDIWRNEPIDWLTDGLREKYTEAVEGKRTLYIHFKATIWYADVFQIGKQWQVESSSTWILTLHFYEDSSWMSWTGIGQHDSEKETDRPN